MICDYEKSENALKQLSFLVADVARLPVYLAPKSGKSGYDLSARFFIAYFMARHCGVLC